MNFKIRAFYNKNNNISTVCTKSFSSIKLYNIKIFWIYIDAPNILTFFGGVSKNNSITLTCIAEGLPEPRYGIFSDKKEIKGTENGILIIPSYHLNDNVAYKCISRNNLGHDKQDFSPSLLRGKFDVVTLPFYYLSIL